jgi:putative Mg2+ transporter-C (MgtC) family protein
MALDLDLVYEFLPKILLAIFCGSLIGLERELKEKPAGMRTFMLICAGSTLFTLIGVYIAGLDEWHAVSDPLRVGAQIVTGIGFLGAGTILFAKGHISGLTSAAAIWMSAAIGMAIAVDMYVFATVVTLVVVLSLVMLGRFEQMLGLKGRKKMLFTITLRTEILDTFQEILKRKGQNVHIIELNGVGANMNMILEGEFTRSEKLHFQKELAKLGGDFKIKVE